MMLTNKQRAFVEHYLATGDAQWNATEAASLAGYSGDRNALAVIGCRNLTKANIRAHIRRRLEEMGATTEELVQRWLHVSRADISAFVTRSGLDVEALKNAGLGFLIKGVRQTKDATTILLRDPAVAEDRLARALGMFVERREHSGSVKVLAASVVVYLPDNQRGDVLGDVIDVTPGVLSGGDGDGDGRGE